MLYYLVENVEYAIHEIMSKNGEKDKISSKENIRDTISIFCFSYNIYSCLCLL